ncbi:hypothetical protein ACFXNW_14285 [Nocardia sp. NPDC059180]|uniref:hypothetical protein n=1 Tax=Nocardia sp. NPDC059180 TaxID=3346761 RepID=UPI00368EF89D
MSIISTAFADTVTTLAQVGNPTPEPPPLADKVEQFLGYGTWLAKLSGTISIIYAGGRFAWEKWSGGALQSPKMIAGALIGGTVATSAGTLMDTVLNT